MAGRAEIRKFCIIGRSCTSDLGPDVATAEHSQVSDCGVLGELRWCPKMALGVDTCHVNGGQIIITNAIQWRPRRDRARMMTRNVLDAT